MFNPKFQYYENDAQKPKALGYVSLHRFLQSIKNPKPQIKEVLAKISIADQKEKSELKKQLYGVTACVNVRERRRYSDITSFTELLILDFDKIDNAIEFKEYLFNEFKSIIACWISPSQRGVKAIVKIPKCTTVDEFKEYFHGISEDMMCFDGFDETAKNAVLLMFISYDKDILIRNNPQTWTKKGVNPKAFKPNPTPVQTPNFDASDLHKRRVTGIIKSMMSKATESNGGHPQIRSTSLILGGYVGYGYISFSEGLQLIYFLIETNGYLQKGIAGYKKTALFFLSEGQRNPLVLK